MVMHRRFLLPPHGNVRGFHFENIYDQELQRATVVAPLQPSSQRHSIAPSGAGGEVDLTIEVF